MLRFLAEPPPCVEIRVPIDGVTVRVDDHPPFPFTAGENDGVRRIGFIEVVLACILTNGITGKDDVLPIAAPIGGQPCSAAAVPRFPAEDLCDRVGLYFIHDGLLMGSDTLSAELREASPIAQQLALAQSTAVYSPARGVCSDSCFPQPTSQRTGERPAGTPSHPDWISTRRRSGGSRPADTALRRRTE